MCLAPQKKDDVKYKILIPILWKFNLIYTQKLRQEQQNTGTFHRKSINGTSEKESFLVCLVARCQ